VPDRGCLRMFVWRVAPARGASIVPQLPGARFVEITFILPKALTPSDRLTTLRDQPTNAHSHQPTKSEQSRFIRLITRLFEDSHTLQSPFDPTDTPHPRRQRGTSRALPGPSGTARSPSGTARRARQRCPVGRSRPNHPRVAGDERHGECPRHHRD